MKSTSIVISGVVIGIKWDNAAPGVIVPIDRTARPVVILRAGTPLPMIAGLLELVAAVTKAAREAVHHG